MKSVYAVVIVSAACMLYGCGSKPTAGGDEGAKPAVAVELTKVERKTIRRLLPLTGSVSTAQGDSAKLAPSMAGRISQVIVREGDLVKKGALLATLEPSSAVAQQNSAAAALEAAKAQATQSQLSYRATQLDQANGVRTAEISLTQAKLERDGSIEQARLQVSMAQEDLAKTRAGARPQEITQARQATVQAVAARDRAAADYHRNQELFPTGYISQKQLEESKTAFETCQSALTAAQANESLVRAGARREERAQAEQRVESAKKSLDSAKAVGDQKVYAAEAALKQAREAVVLVAAKSQEVTANAALAQQKAADLATAEANRKLGEIRAPYDGRISRRLLDQGDSADATTPVLEIQRLKAGSDFLATALPTQASVVKPGMSAVIQIGDQNLDGRVSSISTPDPQTNLCTIRVSLGEVLRPGQSGTAEIVLETLPKVLAVPSSALVYRDGKSALYKNVDNIAKETAVEVGPEDNGFTAIRSGVKEGDSIVNLGGYELDDGTKISSEPAKSDDKADAGDAKGAKE